MLVSVVQKEMAAFAVQDISHNNDEDKHKWQIASDANHKIKV